VGLWYKREKGLDFSLFEMESCCATLGTNTLLVRAGKSGFRDWENGFWGERVRANFNCNVLVNMAPKSQKSDQRGRKFKPGVAVSVLTSNNPTETLASAFQCIYCFFKCQLFVKSDLNDASMGYYAICF